jgi:cell division protein FtsX
VEQWTPEVSGVRFISRAGALADFKATFAGNETLIEVTSESDMPQSFRAKVSTPTGDHVRKIEALGGVAEVMAQGTGFWAGEADLGIHLCSQQEDEEGPKCSGRETPTAEEKTTIYEALSGAASESFYVVVSTPGAAEQVKRKTGNLPGVKEITDDRQWE